MNEITERVIGITKVHLDGSNCRFNECNIGNLITDAFVHTRIIKYSGPGMTDASVGLIGSGDIRSSIKKGKIRFFDLGSVLPFENQLVVINVTGTMLLEVLEHSVERFSIAIGRGEFLQMSGVRVIYDMNKEAGNRVTSAFVLCRHCDIPFYEELNLNQEYGIIVTSFVASGGDGYSMFKVCLTNRGMYSAADMMPLTININHKNVWKNRHVVVNTLPSVEYYSSRVSHIQQNV